MQNPVLRPRPRQGDRVLHCTAPSYKKLEKEEIGCFFVRKLMSVLCTSVTCGIVAVHGSPAIIDAGSNPARCHYGTGVQQRWYSAKIPKIPLCLALKS